MSADVKAYGVRQVVKTWRIILILNLFFNNIKLILHPVRRISKVLKRNRIILFVIFFLLESAGLSLNKKQKGALFGGGITYPIGILCPWIVEPSLRLAQKLPFRFVSTWYFSCTQKKWANTRL